MTDGLVVPEEGGHAVDLPGWSMLVQVAPDATGGRLTAVRGRMDPGHPGAVEHVHDDHDETFVVLEGRLRFRLGERYEEAPTRAVVFAPRGQAHGFSNPFDAPARYLVVLTPSGYERYFERVAAHVARTGQLPDPATATAWMAEFHTRPAVVRPQGLEP